MRIFVFGFDANPNVDPWFLKVTKQKAKELVWTTQARWISDKAIKMRGPTKRISTSPILSDSAETYETIGIEKYPHSVQGGLVRTETQPRKISPFQGARVGH